MRASDWATGEEGEGEVAGDSSTQPAHANADTDSGGVILGLFCAILR